MSETTRVNLVVSDAKKEEWESYATENGEYSSLSDLIRTAVARELKGGHSPSNGSQTEEVERQVAQVVEAVEGLSGRFEAVETRLQALEDKSHTDPKVEQLKGDVFDVLPTDKPGTQEWREHAEDPASGPGWFGTIEGLSEATGEPEYRVREAINRLREETHLIRETEFKDETRFYRRD